MKRNTQNLILYTGRALPRNHHLGRTQRVTLQVFDLHDAIYTEEVITHVQTLSTTNKATYCTYRNASIHALSKRDTHGQLMLIRTSPLRWPIGCLQYLPKSTITQCPLSS